MTDQEIIRALRCSAAVPTKDTICEACPFHRTQELPEEWKGKYPDDFLHGCDVNAIAIIAADRLEELANEAKR